MNQPVFEAFHNGSLKLPEKSVEFAAIPWTKHPDFKGVELKHIVTAKNTGGQFSYHLVHIAANHSISSHVHSAQIETHEGVAIMTALRLQIRFLRQRMRGQAEHKHGTVLRAGRLNGMRGVWRNAELLSCYVYTLLPAAAHLHTAAINPPIDPMSGMCMHGAGWQSISLENQFELAAFVIGGMILHSYIHSFRFAQAQNVMKMVAQAYFFFIILLIGNSVYYKSRGGEWAVRLAG